MNFNYLYYPSIALPDNTWLRKVLLYSDKIASIVPYDLSDSLNYNIELLKSEDEYVGLSPERFLSSYDNLDRVNEFKTEVTEYFSSEHFKKILTNDRAKNKTMLYHSKFSSQIEHFFKDMNLVIENKNNWWETPQVVGDTYLGILAKHMGQFYQFIPTTSSVKFQDIAFKNTSLPKKKIGELRLLDALPSITSDVPIKKIIEFKKQRKYELYQFRTILRDYIDKICETNNEEEMLSVIQVFKEQLEVEVHDIKQMLTDNRLTFFMDSFKSLISLDKDLLGKVATGTIFSAGTGNSILTGAVVGASTEVTLNIASMVKDYRIQRNTIVREKPYTYAFYSKKFIKKTSKQGIFS
jgi:hypothetical protein